MYAGNMQTLEQLDKQVEALALEQEDLVLSTRELRMHTAPSTLSDGTDGPVHSWLELPTSQQLLVRDYAHMQMAERLQMGARYYRYLQADHHALLDVNVNTLHHDAPARRMLRLQGGELRAYLSDRYARRDNTQLMHYVVRDLVEQHGLDGLQVASCNVTDERLYLKLVLPRMQADVKVGDVVQAGVLLRNSEVGNGRLVVAPFTYRLECLNGMVSQHFGERNSWTHVGRQIQEATEEAYAIYTDEALQADERAFWLKVRDVVRAATNEAVFQTLVAQMRGLTELEPMADPVAGVQRLASTYDLSKSEGDGILGALVQEGGATAYHLMNAVTRYAQHGELAYERATELEQLGGTLAAQLTPSAWRPYALAAA